MRTVKDAVKHDFTRTNIIGHRHFYDGTWAKTLSFRMCHKCTTAAYRSRWIKFWFSFFDNYLTEIKVFYDFATTRIEKCSECVWNHVWVNKLFSNFIFDIWFWLRRREVFFAGRRHVKNAIFDALCSPFTFGELIRDDFRHESEESSRERIAKQTSTRRP